MNSTIRLVAAKNVQEDLSNTIEDIPANIADLVKEISNVEPATDKKR